MPDRIRSVALAGAAMLGGLVGCTGDGTANGSPQPVPSSPTSSAPQLAPRPAEVRIDGLDPCTVLTPEQQANLGFDREPRVGIPDPNGNTTCNYSRDAEPGYGITLTPVPQEGAEVWLDGTRNVDVAVLDVMGFAAVETRLAGSFETGPFCNIVVDVADGQSLDVQFTELSEFNTQDQNCEQALQAAEAAMQTLLAR